MTSHSRSLAARRARFPRDVPQITELVELCFLNVLDYSSRRMLREVRGIAQMGEAAWSLARLFGSIRAEEWRLGCVWEMDGRIVGNATLTRRTPEEDAWLISNVAVHPNFRRRGIARGLVEYAIEQIRSHRGRIIYLQVDAENESAVRVYRELGFLEIARRIAWVRGRDGEQDARYTPVVDPSFRISVRKPSEWTEEYALWKDINPYGSAWNTPLTEDICRPSVWKWLEGILSGEREAHFLARRNGRVEAAVSAFSHFSGWEGVLIQRPGTGGRIEEGLLSAAWEVFPPGQSVLLETTPEASADCLVKLGFQKRRTFIWMRYTLNGGAP
jgi:ribosomal protein S18 acetylase RimI-like enzyme